MSAPRVDSADNDDLRALWRRVGGEFHGPNTNISATGTMSEAQLLPLLRAAVGAVHALSLMPCACVKPGMYNYVEKRRVICTCCRAIAQWDAVVGSGEAKQS